MKYLKEVFYPSSLQHAKDVVLTPDTNNPNKFETETNFLIDFLAEQNLIDGSSKVLDFGCGMGRIAKAMIQRFKCNVIGTDFSERMLQFSILYVRDPVRFIATHVYTERDIDLIIASLVLQHTEHPEQEIKMLRSVVKLSGYLVLVNETKRFVPADIDGHGYVVWNDDGINIDAEVAKYFELVGRYPYYNGSEVLSVWKPKNVDLLVQTHI